MVPGQRIHRLRQPLNAVGTGSPSRRYDPARFYLQRANVCAERQCLPENRQLPPNPSRRSAFWLRLLDQPGTFGHRYEPVETGIPPVPARNRYGERAFVCVSRSVCAVFPAAGKKWLRQLALNRDQTPGVGGTDALRHPL